MGKSTDNQADNRLFRRVAIGAAVATPTMVAISAFLSSIASDSSLIFHIGVGIFAGVVAGPFFGSAVAVGYHQISEGGH